MTTPPKDALAEAIERALAAAETATDAAAEAQAASRSTPATAPTAPASGGKAMVVAAVGAVCAALALGASGLVYVRSVADLHDAADMQATAAGVIIERIKTLEETTASLVPDTLARKEDFEKILTILTAPPVEAEAPPPGISAADLDKLRADLMGAIAEVGLKMDGAEPGAGGTDTAQLVMMLGETLRQLEALQKNMPVAVAAASAPAAEQAPEKAKAPAKPAKSRSKPAPKPQPSPYKYP